MEVNCLMGMETDIYIGGSAVLKILFLRYLLVLFIRYNICKIPLNFLNYQKDRKY
jgi:hypothetical protein